MSSRGDRETSSRRANRTRRSRSITRSRSRSFSPRGGGGAGATIGNASGGGGGSIAGGGRFRNRAEDDEGNPHFSNYYRDRFGSESPKEYQNLRVTNIDAKVTNDDLRDALEKYLGRFGDLNVKVIRQMDPNERIAYVNFERIGDARNARHGCLQKLVELLGRRLTVDPAGVVRDQEGRCVKSTTSSNPGVPGARTPPPFSSSSSLGRESSGGFRGGNQPPNAGYRSERDRDFKDERPDDYQQRQFRRGNAHGSYSSPLDQRPSSRYQSNDRTAPGRRPNDYRPPMLHPPRGGPGEDMEATRTLFVGNLTAAVSKNDLQRTFSKYGVIEQIDIKTPHDGPAPYAFVRYQNLAMAQDARHQLNGNCGSWKIGYGKPMPSRRLWVGGLRPSTSISWLEKEFDRFGAIEKIDFVRGENTAYVLFASGEASTEAYNNMKGTQFKDGAERYTLQLDYANSSMYDGNRPLGGGGDAGGGRMDVDSGDYKKMPPNKRPMTPPQPPPASPPPRYKSPMKGASISTLRSPRTPPLPAPSSVPILSPRSGSPSVVQKSIGGGATSGVMISDGTVSSTTTSPPMSLCELSAQNLDELHQLRSPCWTGALVLKKSAYPIRLYKLAGDDDLIDAYLRNERGESVQLTVTQRLKLDQPKQEDVQKWLSSPSDQHAFLLAAANTNALSGQGNLADLQPRPLKLLVKYFKEKDAAGVVSVASNRRLAQQGSSSSQQQSGILYTFPRCQFADLLMSSLCPKLAVMHNCADDCLLVVLQKSAA